MFAIPVILALIAFSYLRPQEFIPVLQQIPVLYILALLLPVAWALDVRLRFSKLRLTPLFGWSVAFLAWSVVTAIVKAPATVMACALPATVSMLLFAAPSQGIQTLRGLRVLGIALIAISLFISWVGIAQEFGPLECVTLDETHSAADQLTSVGVACENRHECVEKTSYDGDLLFCEHIGPVGTTSIGLRSRYRGILQDPNETALVLSMTVPLAFALASSSKSLGILLMPLTLIATGLCTIFTKSRSGQMAYLVAIGVYFVRRLRWLGVAIAVPLAAPVFLFGGRSTQEADESTNERLTSWLEGIDMWKANPIFGVGRNQYTEHHSITAHNSVILALAETGAVGLFLWSSVLYLAAKSTLSLALSPETKEHPEIRNWGVALFASLCSLAVSAFFLSFSDHDIFWSEMGVVGAFVAAAQTHAPKWRLRYRPFEVISVGIVDVFLVIFIYFYGRHKLG